MPECLAGEICIGKHEDEASQKSGVTGNRTFEQKCQTNKDDDAGLEREPPKYGGAMDTLMPSFRH
ncbi:hypothetical protein RE428_48310 [Marinobacter nanhaiticus D15-8W]|nr:hypothetical protein RE428_48310 [Marinobacter nanhaiticus D15-8W]